MAASAYFPTRTLKAAMVEGNFRWEAYLLRDIWPNNSNQILRENSIRPISSGLSVKTKEEKFWRPRHGRPLNSKTRNFPRL